MYEMLAYFNNTLLPATREHAVDWQPTRHSVSAVVDGYRDGDELIKSTWPVSYHPGGQQGKYTRDEEYERAAETAFMVLNRDDRTNHHERSLSCGDVVLVDGPDGERWFSVEPVGFERIERPTEIPEQAWKD